eukprot:SAG11_NODE_16486_length_546_cov_0.812081_1_plen_24_part_01
MAILIITCTGSGELVLNFRSGEFF